MTREGGASYSRVYLDSCAYLEYLRGNTKDFEELKRIIDTWKSGGITIVTSALTIAEVLYVKSCSDGTKVLIPQERERDIIDLFTEYPPRNLVLVELDRKIAESARSLVWQHHIHPKDAVHVASALRAHAEIMFTLDKRLCKQSGKVGGTPTLRIEPPQWTMQASMFDLLDAPPDGTISDTPNIAPTALSQSSTGEDSPLPQPTAELTTLQSGPAGETALARWRELMASRLKR